VCSACVAGKQLGKNHPAKSVISMTRPLELLHLDLFGPSTYDTLEVEDMVLSSWMIIQDIHGCSSLSLRRRTASTSLSSPSKQNVHLKK
jgi:hypothetical protein